MIVISKALLGWIVYTAPSCNSYLRSAFGKLLPLIEVFSLIISLSVSEFFLTIAIPLIALTWDMHLARFLMMVYAQNLFICNFLKNTFCLPRPLALKEGLNQRFVNTYGFPSSHSACSLAVGFFITQYLTQVWGLIIPFPLDIFICIGWAGLVGFARILLEEHSVVDVMGGYLVGATNALGFHYLWRRGIIEQLLSYPMAGLYLASLSAILALVHPDSSRSIDLRYYSQEDVRNNSIRESISIMGCSVGGMIGIWRYNSEFIPIQTTHITYTRAFAIAIFSLFIAKILSNTLARNMIPLPVRGKYRHVSVKLRWLLSYSIFSWILLDPVSNLFAHYIYT